MRTKKISIQMEVTIDLSNEGLENFLTYLPEKLTKFVANEVFLLEDKLCDKDIKIPDEKGRVMSIGNTCIKAYKCPHCGTVTFPEFNIAQRK